jgi:predicted RNA binding protein YcfA (HicA-like mRNA interferase family)
MRIPRDLAGSDLARVLGELGYETTRQTGSHARLTTALGGEHHLSVPMHKALPVGTLKSILREVGALWYERGRSCGALVRLILREFSGGRRWRYTANHKCKRSLFVRLAEAMRSRRSAEIGPANFKGRPTPFPTSNSTSARPAGSGFSTAKHYGESKPAPRLWSNPSSWHALPDRPARSAGGRPLRLGPSDLMACTINNSGAHWTWGNRNWQWRRR